MHLQPLIQPRQIRHVLSSVGVAALLSACTAAQIRMPAGFDSHATAYEVSGHSPRRFNEPVRFGPYSALEMHEGKTFSWTIPLNSVGVGRTSKPYAFTLVAIDQLPVQVQCQVRTLNAGIGSASNRLEVDLTRLAGPMMACGMQLEGEEPAPLELSRTGNNLRGRLVAPWGGDYKVRSIMHMEGTKVASTMPTGYEISGREGVVAVVDLLNAGRVHLDNKLNDDQRVYFAAASAALLMLDVGIDG